MKVRCKRSHASVVLTSIALLLSVALTAKGGGRQSPAGVRSTASDQELRAAFGKAQAALQSKDYATAEREFKDFLKLEPNNPAGYTNLGVVYMRTKRYSDAIQALEIARKLDPDMLGIDLNLGLAFYRQQDFKQAIPYFTHFVSAQPDSLQARYLLGMCHFMLRDYSAAVGALEPLYDQEQDDLDYLYVMGIAYGQLKRNDESRKAFGQLVKAGGETPHLHL